MDLNRIRELLAIVAQSGVAEVEIEEEDFRLVVRRHASTVTVQPPAAYAPYGMNFAAPMPAYAPPAAPAAPMPAYAPPAAPAPVGEAATPTNNNAPAPAAAPKEAEAPAAQEEGVIVRAPIVGTYYASPAPDAPPFVEVGSKVKPGDPLCIIEAMKLMNEIESEVAGVVRQILVENAEPVEYDQPLFIIETA